MNYLLKVLKTKGSEELSKATGNLFEVFDGLTQWVSSVENSGLFSEFYNNFRKVFEGILDEYLQNSYKIVT